MTNKDDIPPHIAARLALEAAGDRMTSEDLAALVVDALVTANIVRKQDFARAVSIAAEEIEVRKALGDY